MKYFYTLITIAFSIQVLMSQNINIQDTNFKNALINTLCVDTNGDNIADDDVDYNNDGEIQITEAKSISNLELTSILTTDLTGLEAFINLRRLKIGWGYFDNYLNDTVTSFDLTPLIRLEYLELIHGESSFIETINLSGLENLKELNLINCRPNNVDILNTPEAFINLNLEGCIGLETLNYYNSFFNINFCQVPTITSLNCSYLEGGEPEIFDFSCLTNLEVLNISENLIDKLILKNGSVLTTLISNEIYSPLPSFICLDDIQEEYDMVSHLIGSNTAVNPYCSFNPGGNYYTLDGQIAIDIDGNECSTNSIPFPNLKFNVNDGIDDTGYIADQSGNYNIALQEGSYLITPILESLDYYSVTPENLTIDFPSDGTPINQNFCIVPDGVKNDLEITLIPLTQVRPGFDTYYNLIYKNKGNNKLSGNVNLTFNDQILDLVYSNPTQDLQSENTLSWSYTDLAPFESRVIRFSLNLNSPVETPPVNNGDILSFTSVINPVSGDETQEDNTFTLNQTVVGSYDPNDKTCLEGNTITPDLIGEYVHYLIRCENTGTANAINIVIKDIIDSTKFDINTLIITGSSHSMVTEINGYDVEFIFKNIELPFDDANNDGYVAFKIKTLPTLSVGDTFENDAEIYFDYNAPILTNKFQTKIESSLGLNKLAGVNDVIKLYPNPSENNILIQSKESIELISLYDISGRLIKSISYIKNKTNIDFNISDLLSGTYMIKIRTNKGEFTNKVIKQ